MLITFALYLKKTNQIKAHYSCLVLPSPNRIDVLAQLTVNYPKGRLLGYDLDHINDVCLN